MKDTFVVLGGAVPVLILLIFKVFVPRVRMARRSRSLLAQHPNAKRTTVYLPLHSTWAWQKENEIEAKVNEMKADGWTYLRATEANPLRTIATWGGGVNLHFIQA